MRPMVPEPHIFHYFVLHCLTRTRKYGFVGGVVSLEVGFAVLKVPISSFCLVLVYQDISFQILLQGHGCMSASMLPAMIIMDSGPLKV